MTYNAQNNILKFVNHPPYCDGSTYLERIHNYSDEYIESLLPEWWYTNNIYDNVDVNSRKDKELYIYNQEVQQLYSRRS